MYMSGCIYMFTTAHWGVVPTTAYLYIYFQFFLPFLSLLMSINRFTAVICWNQYSHIWQWKFYVLYLLIIMVISSLLLHIFIYNLFGCSYCTANHRYLFRIFKTTAYIMAFGIEVCTVGYRQRIKNVHTFDKYDVMLLMQAWLSTSCFLINIGCNQIYDALPAGSFFQNVALFISNCAFVSGFHLPCLYTFVKK
uniref:G_PROTEIN_RECEP_F1_2 domain-containing protein n=1 Tax=Panagrellus redivivus TaxID=6233 RepID=A0A7E4W2G5_PANRE